MAFEAHPLAEGLTLWNVLRVTYLAIFGLYWLYNLAHLCIDLREAAVIAHFTQACPRARLALPAAGACPSKLQPVPGSCSESPTPRCVLCVSGVVQHTHALCRGQAQLLQLPVCLQLSPAQQE